MTRPNISDNMSHFPKEAVILAFDATLEDAAVALWANGEMRVKISGSAQGAQSPAAQLVPSMLDLLKQANLTFQNIDVIAAARGPGSFTGIRIGLAAAQGLLLSTCAKSFAPTTLEAVAFSALQKCPDPLQPEETILVTLSTKRGSFYTQVFDQALVPLSQGAIQTEEEIQLVMKQNPLLRRIQNPFCPLTESLIWLYFEWSGKSHPLSKRSLPREFHPFYLHHPEFAKSAPRLL